MSGSARGFAAAYSRSCACSRFTVKICSPNVEPCLDDPGVPERRPVDAVGVDVPVATARCLALNGISDDLVAGTGVDMIDTTAAFASASASVSVSAAPEPSSGDSSAAVTCHHGMPNVRAFRTGRARGEPRLASQVSRASAGCAGGVRDRGADELRERAAWHRQGRSLLTGWVGGWVGG